MNLLRHTQNLIVPALIFLLVGGGWYFVLQQNQTLTQTTITAYQQTQLEIVRTLARSVDSYVSEQVETHGRTDVTLLEQEIFKLFIAPVRLLQNGDAWIYAPDYVVFDLSSDFPDEYRGKSMAQIFALQVQAGASHYEEMTDAVMQAREGVGWYIWLPDKGQEIAAWTPVKVGQFVWTIGLSTPLPEIMESTGAATQIRNAIALMTLATVLSVGLLFVWVWSAIKREQVDQALRQSEQRLRQIIDAVPHFIFAKDIEGRFILTNQTMADAYNTTIEAVIGKTDADINPSATEREQFRADDLEVLHSGKTKLIREEQVTNGRGQVRLMSTTKIPFTFSGTTAPAVLGIAIDVTEQKQAEAALEQYKNQLEEQVAARTADLVRVNSALQTEITEHKRTEAALREREGLFRALFESSPDAVFLLDPISLVIIDCNKTACVMNGYTKEELIGQSVLMLDILDLNGTDETYLDRLRAAGIFRYETLHRRKDGVIFPLEVSTTIIALQDREILLGIDRDISARKQAEADLRKSEERLRSFLNVFPDIAFIKDDRGLYVDVLVSESSPRYARAVALLKGRYVHEIYSPKITQLFMQIIHQTIETGPQVVEYLLPSSVGLAWYEGRTFPMPHTEGEPRTVFWLARDITARKRAEDALAQARDQALAASNLKTELLAKVSHELRTPLGAILGFTEMLEAQIYGPISSEQQQITAEIIDSTKFLNDLVNQLLDEAQLEAGKMKLNLTSFSPGLLVEEMLAKMSVIAQAKGLILRSEIAPELPPLLSGDLTRIQQILINLVNNAIKFTPQGLVTTHLFQLDLTHWAIQVADTGIGIPIEAQAHIFEPFGQVDGSMTRESQGTGLGLSIVKQLVDLMGGEIKLESDGVPGRGSAFTVILPYNFPEADTAIIDAGLPEFSEFKPASGKL